MELGPGLGLGSGLLGAPSALKTRPVTPPHAHGDSPTTRRPASAVSRAAPPSRLAASHCCEWTSTCAEEVSARGSALSGAWLGLGLGLGLGVELG